MRKGILLAGGTGSRLFPLTLAISKQLLPVYDKPLVYYGLSVLMLAGIKEILIITTPSDRPQFEALLGSGERVGISLSYAEQSYPRGIAEAFLIGQKYLEGNSVALILGDNIFFGDRLANRLQNLKEAGDAIIFSYQVSAPEQYGVIETDTTGKPLSIEEKPKIPKSRYAVTGLYFYPSDVTEIAKTLQPSARGELEITDINRTYLKQGRLEVQKLGRGYAWLDAGTEEDLLEASNFIATFGRRQGVRIGCIEEIAWRMGWISANDLRVLGNIMKSSAYGKYLISLSHEDT